MINEIPPVVAPGRLRDLPHPEFDLPGGLRLRPWEPSDAPSLMAARHDPDIRHWNRPSLLTEPEAVARIAAFCARRTAEKAVTWAVAPAGGGPSVGLISLADLDLPGGSAEFVYWLLPAGRGAGVTLHAVDRVTDWAFTTLGLHRLRITHSVANPASCRVATKAGFPLEGTMRGALLHADGWHDQHLHARLRTDSAADESAAVRKTVKNFIKVTFSAEIAFRLDKVKRGLSLRSDENLAELRDGLRAVIDERELTLKEWGGLSDIDFEDEADLYRYLDGCYAYFFGAREDFPVAPR